ncbi:MAG: sigma-70 family RNA polymerase sigma factor [Ignavibacteriales bacterium]|nr:sigma-70 family RNA polymerase sigma factor [Ignavibacteriales bacterium]
MVEWRDLETLSTLEIIGLINKRKESGGRDKAKAAFRLFCLRFGSELIKKSEIICKKWNLDSTIAIQVVDSTFKRFVKYGKFDLSKSKELDIDKAVLLYLFGIAQRIFADIWRNNHSNKHNPYTGKERVIRDFPQQLKGSDQSDTNSHSSVVMKALSTLTEKHRIVFLTYSSYECDGFKLPRKLLQELRSELNISQTTIRSYHFEAIKKVNEYLEIYGLKEK